MSFAAVRSDSFQGVLVELNEYLAQKAIQALGLTDVYLLAAASSSDSCTLQHFCYFRGLDGNIFGVSVPKLLASKSRSAILEMKRLSLNLSESLGLERVIAREEQTDKIRYWMVDIVSNANHQCVGSIELCYDNPPSLLVSGRSFAIRHQLNRAVSACTLIIEAQVAIGGFEDEDLIVFPHRFSFVNRISASKLNSKFSGSITVSDQSIVFQIAESCMKSAKIAEAQTERETEREEQLGAELNNESSSRLNKDQDRGLPIRASIKIQDLELSLAELLSLRSGSLIECPIESPIPAALTLGDEAWVNGELELKEGLLAFKVTR